MFALQGVCLVPPQAKPNKGLMELFSGVVVPRALSPPAESIRKRSDLLRVQLIPSGYRNESHTGGNRTEQAERKASRARA